MFSFCTYVVSSWNVSHFQPPVISAVSPTTRNVFLLSDVSFASLGREAEPCCGLCICNLPGEETEAWKRVCDSDIQWERHQLYTYWLLQTDHSDREAGRPPKCYHCRWDTQQFDDHSRKCKLLVYYKGAKSMHWVCNIQCPLKLTLLINLNLWSLIIITQTHNKSLFWMSAFIKWLWKVWMLMVLCLNQQFT